MSRRTRSWVLGLAVLQAVTVLQTAAPPQARADTGPLIALVDSLAERLEIAEPVAAFKWDTRGDIEVPGRVEQELAALRDDAASARIDPDYVIDVFTDQINATEAIEYTRFAQWKLDPAAKLPSDPPDLAASRAAIDTLNHKILSQIALNWSLLHSPTCAGELADANAVTVQLRHFENLYQRALMTATRSYCRA
jgi:chorismate mutase